MKRLKNKEKSICGIKHRLLTIIKDQYKYYCYLNAYWSKNDGDLMVYKTSNKLNLLTIIILNIFSFLYNIYTYLLKYPIFALIMLFYVYFNGCYNFIKGNDFNNNIKFFNWINIIIIILLLTFKLR